MLAYVKDYKKFCWDVRSGRIAREIERQSGRTYSDSEERAFKNSLGALEHALSQESIPDDVQVGLEIKVPLTNKRIDFIIAGEDENNNKNVVIVELKQWEQAKHTNMSDVIIVGNKEYVHPSWQAYSYGATIANFNEYVENNTVNITMCTFLHNYKEKYEDEIKNEVYEEGLEKAPAFIDDEWQEFAQFISKSIKKKSAVDLLYQIEEGRIRPSQYLVESLNKLLTNNSDFELIDQQRIAYSNILNEIGKCDVRTAQRKVIIVKGGAGTGKSLIALKLLGALHEKGYVSFYVAKSSYIKESYYRQLTRNVPNYKELRALFLGSGQFYQEGFNTSKQFDCLLVDEAHRLTERTKKSFLFYGNNQIQEIIHASKVSVFFLDETQQIDIKDFGTVENIRAAAEKEDALVIEDERFELKSQFRCNGSDDYIAWVESILYNEHFECSENIVDYDIKVFDDLIEMREAIKRKNDECAHPCRMLSGDVFPWISMNDPDAIDINMGDFHAQWNKSKYFAVDPKSIDQVGCIHTSQGMEFDYVGLIVADDLIYRDGKVFTDYSKHPESAGEFKRPHQRKVKPEDYKIVDRIIRNTYKVLFTRGQRGLYLYIMDHELKDYIEMRIQELLHRQASHLYSYEEEDSLRMVAEDAPEYGNWN